jgi:hypothetical protein
MGVVPSSAQSSDEEISVLGKLPLKDIKVNQIISQNWEGKNFLYLHQPSEDTYALVDVTKPDKPTLVSRSAMKGSAPEGPVGNSPLVISSSKEGPSGATAELPTQVVNFMDVSNPKNPKPLKTFKGVTAMSSDNDRKLVYLVNDEGLWVVRHRNTAPVPICGGGGVNDCLYPGP